MNQTLIEISPSHTSSRPFICEITEGLRKHLGLSKYLQSLKINCGMHTVTCPVVLINEEHLSLSLTTNILDELYLPNHTFTLQAKQIDSAQIRLGPIIGVLTEIRTKQELSFGSIHDFCQELARYCHKNGCLLYIFSLKMYNKDHMTGYCFSDNKWIKISVPYPDVVHNRIHSRKLELSKAFLSVTTDFIENKIPYFNDRFLNKWEVHQILSASEHLIPYLPDSQLLESKATLEQMLHEKKDVFIKPINGSQGKRIFRVIEKDDQSYLLDFTTFSGEINKQYESFYQLFSSLYPRLKREGFLVQETINLKKYEHNTLDFRFLCHKKDQQNWKVSSSVARVSGDNQFVANLARGGSIFQIKDLLNKLYGEKDSLQLRKLLAELSLEIVEVICIQAGGEFGEFGIDLALDEEGKPWIIEVNTKPSKSEDDPKKGKVRPSARAIINYCLFLYNQK
ncbi:YheC/YheD family protein [Metabacillus litoralis]|uniref:YheC/YheD family endospore coat-associated protein n=1 Tax=Metabacillus litoralis TaxID=152268 RepID=UPI001CFF0AB6|nr:YheC/YheD family protein [Metabacillus litoralis]